MFCFSYFSDFLFQNSLADFINIEMIFHARALEYYARCFENIVLIDEDRDLQVLS